MPVIVGGTLIEGVEPQEFSGADAPVDGTDEQRAITVTATDGTFRVAVDGHWTAELAHDITSANLQVALRALPSVNGANVAVAGDAPHTLTFGGNLGRQLHAAGFVTTDVTNLIDGGGAGTAVVAIAVPGVTATGLGAPAGSRYTDATNGVDYVNTGTALDPTWTAVGVGAVMPELTAFAGKVPEAAIADVAGAGIAIAAAVPAAAPAGGTGTADGGWDTAAHRDSAITTINGLVTLGTELKTDIGTLSATVVEIKTQLNDLLAKLRDAGIVTP
jgi:hypothetical protein